MRYELSAVQGNLTKLTTYASQGENLYRHSGGHTGGEVLQRSYHVLEQHNGRILASNSSFRPG